MQQIKMILLSFVIISLFLTECGFAKDVNLGFNYPQTGPFTTLGQHQMNAAIIAVEEINNSGGILGRNIQLVIRDTQSKPNISQKNVAELIDQEGCKMIFGGPSSAAIIAGGKVAKSKGILYLATISISNAVTGAKGHKYMFREYSSAWMAAKALSSYLMKEKLSTKKFFYITADYTAGKTLETSIRTFSMTTNKKRHRNFHIPFPGASYKDISNALAMAKAVKPQVLVLVTFGSQVVRILKMLEETGMKKQFQAIMVPCIDIAYAALAGPKALEGVISTVPWCWNVPFRYNYARGKNFVEKYAKRYNSYPSSAASSAYTVVYEYKEAVERAGTFETRPVIKALENHKYISLKDEQQWRGFDHQSAQTVYVVVCKKEEDVLKNKFKQDYFKIIDSLPGNEAARSKALWQEIRQVAGKPSELEF